MFSRKQFFYEAAGKCFELIKNCEAFFSFQKDDHAKESADLIPESLFIEAISLGIDPGTMDVEQLIQAVESSKAER